MEQNTSKAYAEPDPLANAINGGGAGSALFVINLCASIAPVQIGGKNLPGLENYRLYQVARVEDGRTRHRLRLGFFTSESHAESVLTVVRQQYPTAFTACLCDEDRRFARGYLPDSAVNARTAPSTPLAPAPAPLAKPAAQAALPAAPPAAKAPAASSTPAVKATPTPTTKPAMAPAAATSAGAKAAPTPLTGPLADSAEIIEVTWEPEKPKAAAPAPVEAKQAPAPAASAKQKSTAETDDFKWEPPALNAAKALAEDPKESTARHPVLSATHKTQPVIKSATPATTSKSNGASPPTTPKPNGAAPLAKDPAASSMRIKALELTFSDPPAPAPTAKPVSTEPFHVGKGVQIGELPIALDAEPAAKSAPAPSAASAPKTPAAAKPTAPAATAPAPSAKVATPPAPSKPAAPAAPASRLPDLDTTQTIRALTSAELNDDAQEKYFAIQLAASEQPVNLDTMPHLDIFEAYRLYSIATAGSGKIVHSLRLGFFKEAVSAEAVAGYLKTFFGSPSVLRVSLAEYTRFKDSVAGPRRPEAAEPAKVVELSDARNTRPVVPTVTMEVPTPRVDASGPHRLNDTGSFKANATGQFQTSASGKHKMLTPSLKPAAKAAGPATKRSEPLRKTSATGKHKALTKKSLSEQLLDEAREVELSESGIRKLPKSGSLLSKLLGK